MKALTITEWRGRLGYWLKMATLGEDVGFVFEGSVNPHAHAGLCVRKLGRHVSECRAGLAWRLIFLAEKGALSFDFAGDHDEGQNYLRGKR